MKEAAAIVQEEMTVGLTIIETMSIEMSEQHKLSQR